ncbi:MAG: hypothetical protein GY867_04985 [bacterium]|nr:hypothetical protein [bacterium]
MKSPEGNRQLFAQLIYNSDYSDPDVIGRRQLVSTVKLKIDQQNKDQAEQYAGKKADSERVIPGHERAFLFVLAEIGVTMLAARGAGRDRLAAKGAADGFFRYGHGANMSGIWRNDQQKTRGSPEG